MKKQRVCRNRGWSLIELTIILIVLSILSAILVPVIDRYVRNAKIVRAREDVEATERQDPTHTGDAQDVLLRALRERVRGRGVTSADASNQRLIRFGVLRVVDHNDIAPRAGQWVKGLRGALGVGLDQEP